MKRRIRNLISAIILCMILTASSVCASAKTAGNTPIGVITAAPETIMSHDVVNDPDYLVYQSFLEENSEIVRVMYSAIFTLQETIDVSDYHLSVNDVRILMEIMNLSFPELFYMNGYSYIYWDDTVAFIEPNYTISDPEEKRQAFFEITGSRYLPLIDDSMDDFTKAVILHDELALNSYYAFPEQIRSANSYTYLTEGWGVCQQYTECYAYLLAQCGIKSEIVQSNQMNHAWIKVELDGSYYNIDLTWDDPTPDKVGKVQHLYFLYSDSVFRTSDPQTYRAGHYGYQTIHPSDNTKYDRFENLHSFTTQLCYLNGAFYAITSDGKLVQYDHHTDEITVLSSLDFKWPAGGNRYWIGNFSSLVPFDEKLYYNSPDKVYQYDPESHTTELYAENKEEDMIYGLRVIDNQLWAVCTDSPNVGYAAPVYLADLPEPVDEIKIGDVDDDGEISIMDATAIQRVLANLPTSFYNEEAADVDGDETVTILDATSIQRWLAGLPTNSLIKG